MPTKGNTTVRSNQTRAKVRVAMLGNQNARGKHKMSAEGRAAIIAGQHKRRRRERREQAKK